MPSFRKISSLSRISTDGGGLSIGPKVFKAATTVANGDTLNTPAGVADGDILLAFWAGSTLTSVWAPGWQVISNIGVNRCVIVLAKIAASEGASTTFTLTSGSGGVTQGTGAMLAYAGTAGQGSGINLSQGASANSTAATKSSPAGTSPLDGVLLFAASGYPSPVAVLTVATPPSGMTQRAFVQNVTSGTAIAVYDEAVSAGEIPSKSLTWGGAGTINGNAAAFVLS